MEVNDVEEGFQNIEDDEEIAAHQEEEAEQVQRLPTPEAPTLSDIYIYIYIYTRWMR